MHIEFLVEERSAEAALDELVPKIVPHATFRVHPYQGKPDLLRKLPSRLKGYRRWLPADWRIVVLLDADTPESCRELKEGVEAIVHDAGLSTPSSKRTHSPVEVLVRLAVEELEAWFFGDIDALRTAYPRVPATLAEKAKYRDPDAIRGGTCEELERVLRRAGYHGTRYPKITGARNIAPHMDPLQNHSRSFQVFRDGLLALTSETSGGKT